MVPQKELIAFVHTLCDAAAAITQQYFRHRFSIALKTDASPVTIADQEAEKAIRKHISLRFPDHAILGEEFGVTGDGDWQWVIDPIDGTRSFISGFPTYATLISLLHQQRPVVSAINMPALNERFIATVGQPTTLNNRTIQCATTNTLNAAKLQSTDPGMFTAVQWRRRQHLAQHVSLDRFNGDGYLYAMLAAGWIDLVVEADLKPHDFLPLTLIVEQAGGVISDWSGQALHAMSNGEVLAAATPTLHCAALEQLNS